MEVIEQGWAHHDVIRHAEAPFGQLSKTHVGLGSPETVELLSYVVIMLGEPVIVVIEDGWHGNLKMGFFQRHKW